MTGITFCEENLQVRFSSQNLYYFEDLVEHSEYQFTAIVNENKDSIFNLLFRLTGDYHTSEDLFQETFIRVYKNLACFKGGSKLSTWIYKIALNVFNDYCRKKRWKLLKKSNFDNNCDPEIENHETPELQYIFEEEKEYLQKKIRTLNKTLRVPLVLHYIEGLPINQIADLFNICNWISYSSSPQYVCNATQYFSYFRIHKLPMLFL